MAVSTQCIVCETPDGKLCATCNAASYCSKRCEKRDWQSHKLLCKDFAEYQDEHRPSPDHLGSLLFRVDGEKPELIWLQFQRNFPWVKGFPTAETGCMT